MHHYYTANFNLESTTWGMNQESSHLETTQFRHLLISFFKDILFIATVCYWIISKKNNHVWI